MIKQVLSATELTKDVFPEKSWNNYRTGILSEIPEFKNKQLTSKQRLQLINKYWNTGFEYLQDSYDVDLHNRLNALILGIEKYCIIQFKYTSLQHSNEFGDYYVKMPPADNFAYFIHFEDALLRAKQINNVFKSPVNIYQEGLKEPIGIIDYTVIGETKQRVIPDNNTGTIPKYVFLIIEQDN